jgi:hypothetical protein
MPWLRAKPARFSPEIQQVNLHFITYKPSSPSRQYDRQPCGASISKEDLETLVVRIDSFAYLAVIESIAHTLYNPTNGGNYTKNSCRDVFVDEHFDCLYYSGRSSTAELML